MKPKNTESKPKNTESFLRLPGEKRFVDSRNNSFVTKYALCSVIEECRACEILHEDYKEQLAYKTSHIKKLFSGFESAKIMPCSESEFKTAYRHSVKLVVEEKFEPLKPGQEPKKWLKIGLYKPGTHLLIDVKNCPVQTHLINKICGFLRRELKESKITVFNPKKMTGDLRYLIIRQSRSLQTTLVTLVVRNANKTELKNFARKMTQEFSGRIEGVLVHVNQSTGNSIFDFENESSELLTGFDHMTDTIAGIPLRFSAQSFMQVNPSVAEKMYFRIAELLSISPEENVLDIYCGVGSIGILLSKTARTVVGVEENIHAVSDAIYNAQKNNQKNIEFISGNASQVLEKIVQDKESTEKFINSGKYFDAICLNPPRKGCSTEVLNAVVRANPKRIAYMSCFPDTLKKDLELLCEQNYEVQMIEPYDMFPGTKHVEVLCVLNKK
jgi:23S rRNA (uracil1939-C5)-methyltransferase